jgi:2-polyprenyl-6-methoxyphenol hydroxylase-like FAD-dependent oxidoreductase
MRRVVIAGAGPAGLMLAAELRLAGVEIVVLERRPEPRTSANGLNVHGRTVELLRRRGLADRLLDDEPPVWPRVPFGLVWLDLGGMPPEHQLMVCSQWRLERVLLDRARQLGADVRYGWEVLGLSQDADGVELEARGPGGTETFPCAYAVGCDGPHSVVRSAAGIGFPGEGLSTYGLLGDFEVADWGPHLADNRLFPHGMYGAVPKEPGILRLMSIELDRTPPGPEVPVTAGELRASIERVTGAPAPAGEPRWLSRYGGPTSLAQHYRRGRVFLAGDAAHLLFASGTQGINAGLHDAVNLGWKLAATLNGWAPAGLLETYEQERRAVGEVICRHSRASMGLLHPQDRVGALRSVFGDLARLGSVVRALHEMSTDTGEMTAGRLIPDLPLHAADPAHTSVAATLRSGRGVLLELSGAASLPAEAAVTAVKSRGDRLDLVVADPVPELGAGRLLIRPDGHTAYAGEDDDELGAAVERWFGQAL